MGDRMREGWMDRMTSARWRVRRAGLVTAVIGAAGLATALGVQPADSKPTARAAAAAPPADKVLFFASDGLRQDAVAGYVKDGALPGFGRLLRSGAHASGSGMLTQAPPNTGAGWYTLATGAWPAVHGSTNNTFHIVGAPFGNRTAAFDPNVLQAESIAQAAERAGKRVAQIEWAGGRNASIDGPTLDFRTFVSGRGVVTNYTSPTDLPNFISAFGLQYDKADPTDATGRTDVPRSFSPPKELRLRVLDAGVDKYGLNAYIYDSRNDGHARYDRVLFSPTKDGDDAVANLREGGLADVKVTIQGGSLDGKTGGMLVKVERLAGDLSEVRLFHTSVGRANASWPSWPGEKGFKGSFEDFVNERFPS